MSAGEEDSVRAWRRGRARVDLVVGQFANLKPAQMTKADFDEFERLMKAARSRCTVVDHRRGADPAGLRHGALRARLGGAAQGGKTANEAK